MTVSHLAAGMDSDSSAQQDAAWQREAHRWAQRQTATAELTRQALAGADPAALAAEALRSAAHLVGISHADILLLPDTRQAELHLLAGFGWPDAQEGRLRYCMDEDDFATAVLADHGPITLAELAADRHVRLPDHVTDAGLSCGIATTIGSPSTPRGLLAMYSRQARDFDACDRSFVRAIALVLEGAVGAKDRNQTSRQAMADLEAELRERIGHLRLLCDVAAIADSSRPPASAIEAALGRICECRHWPMAHAFLLDPWDATIGDRIWSPPAPTLFRKADMEAYVSHASLRLNALHEAVLREDRTQWSPDLAFYSEGPGLLQRGASPVGSVLAIPIRVDQQAAGVAEFFLPDAAPPGPELLAIMSQVGTQLGRVVERSRAAAELERRDRQLAELSAAQPGLIALLDHDCRYRFANAAHCQWLGLAPDMILGHTLHEIWGEKVAVATAVPVEAVLSGRRQVFELELAHHEHGPRTLDVVLTPAFDDGQPIGFYLAGTDITERKAAERRAGRHQAQLAHMGRIAMLGEVSGSIAHDLNQPLSAIVSYAAGARRRLQDGRLSAEESKEVLERIDEMARRAGTVLHRLREFAQRGDTATGQVNLNTIATQASRLVETTAEDANISLSLNLADELPPFNGHGDQIQQLIVNLLTNAIEAINGNPPDAPRRIELRTQATDDGHIELTVADSGPGASAETLAHIFDPFFTTKPEGLGMGLAISSSTAEAHGGRLIATANAGRGVTLTLKLPLAGA